MESLLSKVLLADISTLLDVVKRDKYAEAECKILAGKIQTKDVADRIIKAIEGIARGTPKEEHRATFAYADGLRVSVIGAENIHKVCTTNSFRGVPLSVERKRRYYDLTSSGSGKDVVDVPDLDLRFTLRHEEPLRKDFSGAPMDKTSHLRIMHRKTWVTLDGLLQIDMSLVKTKLKSHNTFAEVLRQTPSYELEIEVLNREADVIKPMLVAVEKIVAAYQQTAFIIPKSDVERYKIEFESMKTPFINPVTMERRHIKKDRPFNVLTDYTVTNKADGDRCFLVVMRDRRVVRISPRLQISWTGLTANKDNHFGDIMDGEYLSDRNLFCIFDVYSYRGKDTRRLPLMTTDTDVLTNPTKSRLGCAREFVNDLMKDFSVLIDRNPMRVETKMFLAGDGLAMENSIRKILDTKFEYPTDGLVFTPRTSTVAPISDRRGNTWLRVYKWKPADQNSIDFLVKLKSGESYDPVLGSRVTKGTLYVSKTTGTDIVYPCETMTGEYVPPRLPDDLRVIAETRNRVPSPFQPAVPRDPEAYNISIPLDNKGTPIDKLEKKIEDNTIIECVRDTDKGTWSVLRTRYDKTYEYRVLGQAQFGNDINVAESIWTNIHTPITENMIRNVSSNPPDDTFEDDLYYRDSLDARDRILKDVYGFHNRIKDKLYQTCIKSGDTLLELAVGRGGDMLKWKKSKVSKVVGVDISASNLESPRQGACVRYLKDRAENPTDTMPAVLFIKGDMSQPLFEQDNHYINILSGKEPAPTPYLEKFAKLAEFDAVACQMAIHYACASEDTFRVFVKNLTDHGKGMFFGTCLDGRSVYSLLLGKPSYTFRADSRIFGEFTKNYTDESGWEEEFGKSVKVHLESFEQAQSEYLVPFDKVVEILKGEGYELISTSMFSDHYAQQNRITLTQEQQTFSFLHRSFVFKKGIPPPKKKEEELEIIETESKVDVPIIKVEEEDEDSPVPVKIKRRLAKLPESPKEQGPAPVLFSGADESKGEFRVFDTGFERKFQVDSITFPSLEHYFEWTKAKTFGDGDMATKILKTASPKSVKALGKKVKGVNEEEWSAKQDEIMRIGVRAKITQHPDIRAKLLETGDRPIGLADARDKYWGIGTSLDKDKAKDPSKWPGKNVLGKILMDLRKELSASSA
jgi:ribA/ribD-fused uncharacterized protein